MRKLAQSVPLRFTLAAFCLSVPLSCAPLPQYPFFGTDYLPPQIVGIEMAAADRLVVSFDEPCALVEQTLLHSPSVGTPVVEEDHSQLVFRFPDLPAPAVEHFVEGQVTDQVGNNLRFVVRFYGWNLLLPTMVINEFTPQGSGNHPDIVEIAVLSDGNLAGGCVFEGTPGNWEQRLVFPDVDVLTGQFIVVHFKPESIPAEVNETVSMDESGGLDSTPSSWDYWVEGGTGLSGNNGAITLCINPMGGIVDSVLYSNRTSDSDENYRGFGSKDVMERADELFLAGAWLGEPGSICPEDAVDPEDSTATRSISRGSNSADTDSRADWHITPTRGLSVGAQNTDEVYEP